MELMGQSPIIFELEPPLVVCCQLVATSINKHVHFLLRDARSAKRGIAIVSRPSVCLSVCLSVRLSVTLTYRWHIGWTSSELIARIISLGPSLLGATTSKT